MKALGRHILAEIYDCNPNVLNDRELIEEILVKAALEAGAEVRRLRFINSAPKVLVES